MTKIDCVYSGDGQTRMTHSDSGAEIVTDLPVDNGGQGRCFSPTDLFASSLAACTLTIMGMMAKARGDSIDGTRIVVEKEMSSSAPRRISKITLAITFPDTVSADAREKYMSALKTCPVHNSIGDGVEIVVE
ncbi:MAG: OsmC family protein [Thermoguttaceae bacterium]